MMQPFHSSASKSRKYSSVVSILWKTLSRHFAPAFLLCYLGGLPVCQSVQVFFPSFSILDCWEVINASDIDRSGCLDDGEFFLFTKAYDTEGIYSDIATVASAPDFWFETWKGLLALCVDGPSTGDCTDINDNCLPVSTEPPPETITDNSPDIHIFKICWSTWEAFRQSKTSPPPSPRPSVLPSLSPTLSPSSEPTTTSHFPTVSSPPSQRPSPSPSLSPSVTPSAQPSNYPVNLTESVTVSLAFESANETFPALVAASDGAELLAYLSDAMVAMNLLFAEIATRDFRRRRFLDQQMLKNCEMPSIGVRGEYNWLR